MNSKCNENSCTEERVVLSLTGATVTRILEELRNVGLHWTPPPYHRTYGEQHRAIETLTQRILEILPEGICR